MNTFNPTLLTPALQTIFLQELQTAKGGASYLADFGTLVKSDKRSENYAWVGPTPRFRLMRPDRETIFDGMTDGNYTLENQTWKAGIGVKREDLEDDQTGALRLRISQLAEVAAQHHNRLLIAALADGEAQLCYDGTPFFGNSHPARNQEGSTQDNLLAGSGTSVSQLSQDFGTGLATMLGFVGENGEPVNADNGVDQICIVHGPALRNSMITAIQAPIVSSTSNVQTSGLKIKLVCSGRLTGNSWYMLNVGGAVRPILLQERMPAHFESLENESEGGMIRDLYRYQARWRGRPGYGHWAKAVKFVVA